MRPARDTPWQQAAQHNPAVVAAMPPHCAKAPSSPTPRLHLPPPPTCEMVVPLNVLVSMMSAPASR